MSPRRKAKTMSLTQTIRRTLATAGLACLLAGSLASAQVASYGDKATGENTGDQLPKVLKGVAVSQHLNQQLPLDATFVDDTGKTVKLGDYFGKKPAILTMVYYNCPMLCS
jgi:protein SCO1/2